MAFEYEVVTVNRVGIERVQPLVLPSEPRPGTLVTLDGRDWLVDAVEEGDSRVVAKPARYRLCLRHPDGLEELGAFKAHAPRRPAARPRVYDDRGRYSGQLGGDRGGVRPRRAGRAVPRPRRRTGLRRGRRRPA